MYRGATISVAEVEMLRTIGDVVRKGYVRRIERDKACWSAAKRRAPGRFFTSIARPGRSVTAPMFRFSMVTGSPSR